MDAFHDEIVANIGDHMDDYRDRCSMYMAAKAMRAAHWNKKSHIVRLRARGDDVLQKVRVSRKIKPHLDIIRVIVTCVDVDDAVHALQHLAVATEGLRKLEVEVFSLAHAAAVACVGHGALDALLLVDVPSTDGADGATALADAALTKGWRLYVECFPPTFLHIGVLLPSISTLSVILNDLMWHGDPTGTGINDALKAVPTVFLVLRDVPFDPPAVLLHAITDLWIQTVLYNCNGYTELFHRMSQQETTPRLRRVRVQRCPDADVSCETSKAFMQVIGATRACVSLGTDAIKDPRIIFFARNLLFAGAGCVEFANNAIADGDARVCAEVCAYYAAPAVRHAWQTITLAGKPYVRPGGESRDYLAALARRLAEATDDNSQTTDAWAPLLMG